MINRQLIVKGKVQGVSFRVETMKMAGLLKVNGYVKNMPDGSVFVELEGEEENVYSLIDYCHHGPEKAEVEHVSITMSNVVGYNSFEIRY
ncbi:MAG TPA: acylphosphatase [Chitinophagales bacterium]